MADFCWHRAPLRIMLDEAKMFVFWWERLQRAQRIIHKLDEAACNTELTKRQETRKANVLKMAKDEASAMGFELYHQSDPRGCALWLVTPELDNASRYSEGLAVA